MRDVEPGRGIDRRRDQTRDTLQTALAQFKDLEAIRLDRTREPQLAGPGVLESIGAVIFRRAHNQAKAMALAFGGGQTMPHQCPANSPALQGRLNGEWPEKNCRRCRLADHNRPIADRSQQLLIGIDRNEGQRRNRLQVA